MKVLVTGATGFVGGHTAVALAEAGHELRLLVRDRERAEASRSALGLDGVELVLGDVTDRAAVETAVDGCEAVVHAAAVVALDRRRTDEAMATNATGSSLVLRSAASAGARRIVHVSSTSALEGQPGRPLAADDPPAQGPGYGASKAAAERIARDLQDEGVAVSITYPSGIIGPAAGTALGETSTGMAGFVAAGIIPTAAAGNSLIDVRDLARIHQLLVDAETPVPRVMCGGSHVRMPELAQHLRALTGRRFPVLPLPPRFWRLLGRGADRLASMLDRDLPINEEGMTLITTWAGTADDVEPLLGVSYRPLRSTLADALTAWRAAGLLTERQAGRPKGAPPCST